MNKLESQLFEDKDIGQKLGAKARKTTEEIVVHKMPRSSYINNHDYAQGSHQEEGEPVPTKKIRGAGNHKQLGMIIIVLGILVIIALGYFAYTYLIKPSLPDSSQVEVVRQTPSEPVQTSEPNEPEVVTPEPTENLEEVVDNTDEVVASSSEDILDENLDEIMPEETEPVSQPISIADADSDGLYDLEEGLIGSDPYTADSDGDGYSDLSELLNLYNPNGSGKLENAVGIGFYESPSFNFSLLYPSAWGVGATSDDTSVVFKINNSAFVQMIIQDNLQNEEIASWYERQFPNDVIDESRLLKMGSLEGISSADGLIVYATDSEFIYILSYVPENELSLNYFNVFQMMLNSFSLN